MAAGGFYRKLQLGSSGLDVAAVKTALQAWRSDSIGNLTEVYGEGAVLAVKAFQNAHGVAVSGLYGTSTHAKLSPFFSPAAAALYESARPQPVLVQPIPRPQNEGIVSGAPSLNPSGPKGGIHETEGLPGYPALDFLGPAEASVLAFEAATVERFSGHDPAQGPVEGIHGPFGWSVYLRAASGVDYYVTHLGSRVVNVGDSVKGGQQIGTVADYAHFGGTNHAHVGVHGASGEPYTAAIRRLGNAPIHASL